VEAVTDQHTREGDGDLGPHWCKECSEAASEYVEWPCSRERLVKAVRANEQLHRGYESAGVGTKFEESPTWPEIEDDFEGGQPNGTGTIEPSWYREWFTDARESHHRRRVILYGPWQEGSLRDRERAQPGPSA
jgi:hypothetical protein